MMGRGGETQLHLPSLSQSSSQRKENADSLESICVASKGLDRQTDTQLRLWKREEKKPVASSLLLSHL